MAMDFSGEYRIPAKTQRVWEALNDPAVLRACIAGCKQLDKISDTEFSAIVVAKVGPVSATFRGNVVLSDLDPPNGYTLTGQGQGGAAGFARMGAQVSLAADGDQTLLSYAAKADIGGKLASVGSRLVQTVAKKNADDFFAAFAVQLGGTGVQEKTGPAAAAQAAGTPTGPGLLASLASPVPAWLVVFGWGVGCALGYMLCHLR
ncbi:MAG: carbon monoxide dehydrogenase [Herminiimonas sp.]|jgi:carbon monoxide dehydrogenase subunit G|nr:carbon monoxide dehydrogenase [Herminiimonas sp.]